MQNPSSAAGLRVGSLFFLALLSACNSDDPEIFLGGRASDELTAVADAAADTPTIRNLTIQIDSPEQGFQWRVARGVADTPNGTPMTIDSAFRTRDVGNMFTSVVILKLIENGFFTLDTPLSDILDDDDMPAGFTLQQLHRRDGELRGGDLTIRQLLGHTSGLRDTLFDKPTESPDVLSLAQLIVADVFGDVPSGIRELQWSSDSLLLYFFGSGMSAYALAAPGAAYHRADTNYLLLGIIIEKVSQLSLAEIYRNAVYGPAQMTKAYLEWFEDGTDEPVDHFWAVTRNDELQNIDVVASDVNTSNGWGGGGIVTDARELNGFIRELFDGGFFTEAATLTAMRTSGPTPEAGLSYGLGLEHRVYTFSGKTIDVYGHSGFWGTGVYYIPATNTSIVYTMNQVELDEDWLQRILRALDRARLFSAVN
ncbi:MAG: serine hydrolase domain-containing protein [Pseudomonadota bacterium]